MQSDISPAHTAAGAAPHLKVATAVELATNCSSGAPEARQEVQHVLSWSTRGSREVDHYECHVQKEGEPPYACPRSFIGGRKFGLTL